MTTAAELKIGQRGKVEQVTGSDAISVRLLEMGLTPGVEITLLGTAPLGDPLELSVRGYRLSLRRREAQRVTISMLAGTSGTHA